MKHNCYTLFFQYVILFQLLSSAVLWKMSVKFAFFFKTWISMTTVTMEL